jgi:hypothetical protein
MRIGDSHGLMRALDSCGRLRIDEFATGFAAEELYPPELENAFARTREYIALVRGTGLVDDDRGILELSEIGRRYIRAGSAEQPYDVAPAQAELLRRLLRERHESDGIYQELAVALVDGAHDERHLTLLRDMELIREDRTLTETGERMRAELTR